MYWAEEETGCYDMECTHSSTNNTKQARKIRATLPLTMRIKTCPPNGIDIVHGVRTGLRPHLPSQTQTKTQHETTQHDITRHITTSVIPKCHTRRQSAKLSTKNKIKKDALLLKHSTYRGGQYTVQYSTVRTSSTNSLGIHYPILLHPGCAAQLSE